MSELRAGEQGEDDQVFTAATGVAFGGGPAADLEPDDAGRPVVSEDEDPHAEQGDGAADDLGLRNNDKLTDGDAVR